MYFRPLLQDGSRPEPVPSGGQCQPARSYQKNNNVLLAEHVNVA